MTSIWCVRKDRVDIERRRARFMALKKTWAGQDFRVFGRADLPKLRGQSPDVLIVFGPEASVAVRSAGLKAKFKVLVPSYWRGRLRRELIEIKAGRYDLLLPTDLPWIDEFHKIHPRVHYVGRGFDPEIFRPDPTAEKVWTVSFIGNPDGFNRHHYLDLMKRFLPKGELLSITGKNHREMARYLQESKIGWNQILNPDSRRGINYRVWEVTACGAALFTNPTDDVKKIFKDGVTAVFWKDGKDLIDKLGFYLGKRKPGRLPRIAKQGCELAHSTHTWDRKAQELKNWIGRYYKG